MPTTPTSRTSSASSPGAPGDLDTSTWNISRQPGSTIAFAAFDPATASGDHTNSYAFRKLSLNEELCRPKRIVVETAPDGNCTWRFVPNARWEAGVENEGIWPRDVYVCGELTTLTRDQWDMYKLDQRFDCVVKPSPNHTVITKSTREPSVNLQESANVHDSPLHNKGSKRRLSDNVYIRRTSGSNSDDKKKKLRTVVDDFSSSSSSDGDDEADEDEVNMIIDEGGSKKKHLPSDRLKKVRANIDEARKKRWEANARKRDKSRLATTLEEVEEGENGFDDDEGMMSWSEIPNSPQMRPKSLDPPISPSKRNTYVETDDSDEFDDMMSWAEIPNVSTQTRAKSTGASASPSKRKTYVETDESDALDDHSDYTSKPRFKTYEKIGPSKRTRTVSPGAAKRAFELRKNRRGGKRKKELQHRTRRRSEITEENELKRLYEEVAKLHASSNSSSNTSSQSSPTETTQDAMDEEAYRQAMLEESRRKIAELEKDRPIWDKQARRRAAEEAEENARAEAARKARAASQAADAEQQRKNAQRHAEEAERQKRDAAAADLRSKRTQARNAAQRDARIWIARGWNARAALERYGKLSDAFDRMSFLRGDVIVFETIPWPVLSPPGSFGVEDVDWTSVEKFFRQVRAYLPNQEYVKLVEKSHKRFHPDRWRSRRVLQCVEDDEEKECLEVAANTVAQALTPLWQDVTGR